MSNFQDHTFKVSRTFQEFTPKSIRDGVPSDHGFEYEDREMDWDDALSELQDCVELSNSITCVADVKGSWASTDLYDYDYTDGTKREECIHVEGDANAIYALYLAAGLV